MRSVLENIAISLSVRTRNTEGDILPVRSRASESQQEVFIIMALPNVLLFPALCQPGLKITPASNSPATCNLQELKTMYFNLRLNKACCCCCMPGGITGKSGPKYYPIAVSIIHLQALAV